VREQLLKLKIFDLLVRLIKVQENQTLPQEELLRELSAALRTRNSGRFSAPF